MPNLDVFLGKVDRSKLSADNKAMWELFVTFYKEINAEKDKEIAELKGEVKSLQDRLQAIEDKQDVAGQYSRLDTLTISPKKDSEGVFLADTIPNFDKAENCKTIVRELFKDHLNLELAETDISICHRLQPPRKAKGDSQPPHDRRNIIIRFCRKDLISTIFKHCKQMSPPFYVNESLTPVRNSICYALRTLKKKYESIERVRSFKGVPQAFVRPPTQTTTRSDQRGQEKENLRRIDIPTVLELERFAKTHLDTTLQREKISIKNRV